MGDDTAQPQWSASPRRRMAWRMVAALALVALVVVWVVMFRPQVLGGPAQYAGVSGTSMIPTLHDGDLTVAVRDASYQEGDIIVFHVPAGGPHAGLSVIHRIVGGDGTTGFVTKGDNNPVPDPWHPTSADVVGQVWLVVPGKVRWVIAVVVGVLLVLLVIAAWPSRRRRSPTVVPGGSDPGGGRARPARPRSRVARPSAADRDVLGQFGSGRRRGPDARARRRRATSPDTSGELATVSVSEAGGTGLDRPGGSGDRAMSSDGSDVAGERVRKPEGFPAGRPSTCMDSATAHCWREVEREMTWG